MTWMTWDRARFNSVRGCGGGVSVRVEGGVVRERRGGTVTDPSSGTESGYFKVNASRKEEA